MVADASGKLDPGHRVIANTTEELFNRDLTFGTFTRAQVEEALTSRYPGITPAQLDLYADYFMAYNVPGGPPVVDGLMRSIAVDTSLTLVDQYKKDVAGLSGKTVSAGTVINDVANFHPASKAIVIYDIPGARGLPTNGEGHLSQIGREYQNYINSTKGRGDAAWVDNEIVGVTAKDYLIGEMSVYSRNADGTVGPAIPEADITRNAEGHVVEVRSSQPYVVRVQLMPVEAKAGSVIPQ